MDDKTIYAVKMAGESKYTSLACYCQMWDNSDFKGLCFLTPDERPHMIEGELLKESKNGFKFRSDGYAAGEWKFKALTLDNFRKEYHKLVIGGEEIIQSVRSTEQLHNWFTTRYPAPR